jgi:hypothetical protein
VAAFIVLPRATFTSQKIQAIGLCCCVTPLSFLNRARARFLTGAGLWHFERRRKEFRLPAFPAPLGIEHEHDTIEEG